MYRRGLLGMLLIAAALAVFAVGCGSSSDSSDSGSTASESETASSGGDEEFAVPGAKNGLDSVGKEASDSEREAASIVLEENLEARATGDWAAQCASLSSVGVKSVEENPTNQGKTCAQALGAEAAGVPKALLENTLDGEIDALRIKGTNALALWHGTGGADYAMAMENENGQWKVASLTTNKLPKPNSGAKPEAESKSKSK